MLSGNDEPLFESNDEQLPSSNCLHKESFSVKISVELKEAAL